MRLRLRQFELRAMTSAGPFGIRLPFDPGLVVLRADNTSGKSTCLQGIIYALGLEGMLSASHAIPLPHVATSSLTDEDFGRELGVLESHVMLEFENEAGQVATVRRYVKHGDIDTGLITVWDGPMLSSLTCAPTQAGLARRSGRAFSSMPGARYSSPAARQYQVPRQPKLTIPTRAACCARRG
jgi:hypothetical protein